MLLEVRNLRVHYEKVEALKGISLRVEREAIVCLIGANGAGKTTLLRTISGLKKPSSGEIWFEGERIDGLPSHDIVKRGIIQVPEGRRLFPFLSVLDNLKLGASSLEDKNQIKRNYELVYSHFPVLKERAKQQAGSLSGGEQQMLSTARALMAGPKLLLLDEPSLGLSPLMVQKVARITTDINREGTTIFLVEQNAFLALTISSQAYAIETGSIALEGDPAKLLHDEHVKKVYLGG